jgi:hypothetical protein
MLEAFSSQQGDNGSCCVPRGGLGRFGHLQRGGGGSVASAGEVLSVEPGVDGDIGEYSESGDFGDYDEDFVDSP